MAENDNLICALVRTATIDQGAGFLDLRPAVRAAGANKLLHGPHDFGHFNRNGMEVLGQEVARRIDSPLAQDSCLNLEPGETPQRRNMPTSDLGAPS